MPTRRSVLSGSFAALALSGAARAQSGVTTPPTTQQAHDLNTEVAAFVERHRIPALSVAFARDGVVLHRTAAGLADRDTGEGATPDHRFRIASLSKPITAVAIMQLVEAGRLSLDAPVFGPDGALGRLGADVGEGSSLRRVTVDHLLLHTVGAWPNDATDPMNHNLDLDHAALIALTLRSRTPWVEPGERFVYSNFGYCLLGRIVEAVTGRPYARHVGDAVLAPVGAAAMTIGGSRREERQPSEVRHHQVGSENPYGMNLPRRDANGGWIATPGELALFVAAAAPASRHRLLTPASRGRMITPSAANKGYARGWNVNAAGNMWHVGSQPGTQTIAVATRSGLAWALFVNARPSAPGFVAALDALGWALARKVPHWGVR